MVSGGVAAGRLGPFGSACRRGEELLRRHRAGEHRVVLRDATSYVVNAAKLRQQEQLSEQLQVAAEAIAAVAFRSEFWLPRALGWGALRV